MSPLNLPDFNPTPESVARTNRRMAARPMSAETRERLREFFKRPGCGEDWPADPWAAPYDVDGWAQALQFNRVRCPALRLPSERAVYCRLDDGTWFVVFITDHDAHVQTKDNRPLTLAQTELLRAALDTASTGAIVGSDQREPAEVEDYFQSTPPNTDEPNTEAVASALKRCGGLSSQTLEEIVVSAIFTEGRGLTAVQLMERWDVLNRLTELLDSHAGGCSD